MNSHILQDRLINFGVAVLKLARRLPAIPEAQNLRNQLSRSATSPALHYGEAVAAESRRDFTHKIKVVLKELRETHNALRLVLLMEFLPASEVEPEVKEGNELVAIFTTTVKTLAGKNPKS